MMQHSMAPQHYIALEFGFPKTPRKCFFRESHM